ncbi:uncharacterized protein [Amphiura filiformis]|uniref:uncharacterized protein n=1 Tax=Amphiura filiformis TaxID=82378 RepID=UPI003B21552D
MTVEIYRRITRTIGAITNTHVLCVFIIAILTGLPKFTYGNTVKELPLTAIMSELQCFKCGAWEYETDFDRTLHACLNNPSSTSVEYCPGEVNGVKLSPSCVVTKQTSAGHITSFSRGCHSLINCTEVDNCDREDMRRSGACKSCCSTSLCNSVPQRTQYSLALTLMVLFVSIMCTKLVGR